VTVTDFGGVRESALLGAAKVGAGLMLSEVGKATEDEMKRCRLHMRSCNLISFGNCAII
jgi:hypothetical protein